MSTPNKKLKEEARELINIKELFPRSNIDLRSNLTNYQAKKIKAALKEVRAIAGTHIRNMVPMGRGRKRYMAENNLPPYMRGIFLSGGAKINKKLEYKNGGIYYERGGAGRERHELYTYGDDYELRESARTILKNRKNRRVAITAAGYVIGGAQGMHDNDTILKEATNIFLKYADMAAAGEKRERHGGKQDAAHPSIWGMGILFEKGAVENGAKKKQAKKGRARK